MGTNVELAKKVEDQEEENRELRERLEQLEIKLVLVEVRTREVSDKVDDKGKLVAIQNEIPIPNPVL